MSKTDASFDAIRDAISTLWPADELKQVQLDAQAGMLLLRLPSDVAAFAVLDGHPERDFPEAYANFKRLYRENSRVWDERTLSFVVCRSSDHTEDDRFYAALETDPLFCRKYVIRAHETVDAQRDELLRLPFLPLPADGEIGLQRPPAAQDLLQLAGVSAVFARNLIEPGKRSAERIAQDLRNGNEALPALTQPRSDRLSVTTPRATSRMVSLTVEGFRAYREAQTFDLDASVIVLYGPNGLGKTSAFDAIDYACTGRVGRLCRTKRTQSDFARIATHLDKAPGSGSVALTVKSDGVDAREWKLQRSTGDWGTAWIDGQAADRKTVINKLTQASWIDTSPRQQTLESLFRATHLFGQDEQELLIEFRKASIIPETFISEMLSLQDYSEGLTKIDDVLSELSKHRLAVDGELNQLRDETATIEATLTNDAPDSGSAELTPVESVIENLRQEVGAPSLQLEPLPEALTVAAYTEWHDVAVSRRVSIDERIQSAQTLRDELPAHNSRVREQSDAQARLDSIDIQLTEVDAEELALGKRTKLNESALTGGEARRRQLEERRKSVRSASEALSQHKDLSKQMAAQVSERDRQILERSNVDTHLTTSESALSKALSDVAELERAVLGCQTDLAAIESRLEELPQFAKDTSLDTDIKSRVANSQQELRDAEARQAQVNKDLQAARLARELREPAYQRAVAAQTEIETLLDSIQGHVHSDSCPLCGSQFESVEALLAKIRSQRESASAYSDVTTAYQALVATETQLGDQLTVAAAQVAMAKAALDELLALQETVGQRLREFRSRIGTALVAGADANELGEALTVRQQSLRDQAKASEETAEAARRRLAALQTSHADDTARRKVIQERVVTLDRAIQDLADQTTSLTASIERVFPAVADIDGILATEIATIERSLDEVSASIGSGQEERKKAAEAATALKARRQSLSETRAQIVVTLGEMNQTIAAFRQKLRALGVSDDGDDDSLSRTIREETKRSDAIGAMVATGLVVLGALRVREVRQRLEETRSRVAAANTKIRECEEQLKRIKESTSRCSSIEALLKRERQAAIERHIAAYGPVITMIQQRLRSVYGFGGVQLEAHGGEAQVRVEWRSKSVQVPPTDFFSDSQKQILMLSIFMAGGLRQNWSGFAPVLLDDPVTHFDDLNAYAFVELIRGVVATSPTEWQFVVSTCEQRLFDLMQKKFSRLPSGAVFYEFLGMTEKGPIVERR